MEGMKDNKKTPTAKADVIPLFGRDELNLIEFPFGPITAGSTKTFEVEHVSFDRAKKREVRKKLLITGSDAFGLPRPFDDQVIMGMKALTYEAGFTSKRVEFSRYRLCKTLGLPTNGNSYRRLEESFDRIAGTTLKFKDSWWDNGEDEWLSKTFHLIEEVELCSRDRFDRARHKNKSTLLCSFVWSDTIWKSFTDGYIKKIDMTMWRRIGSKPRKDVALRLYRILDKRFYWNPYATFDLSSLCKGTLGVNQDYAPSQMERIINRSSNWLIECGFIRGVRFKTSPGGKLEAMFIKANPRDRRPAKRKEAVGTTSRDGVLKFFDSLAEEKQKKLLSNALEYCKLHAPKLYDGFNRNETQGGATFSEYRELVIKSFLTSRKKRKTAA